MSASAPQLDVCPTCGQQSDGDLACTRCAASLRVELWLDAPVLDDRRRFRAARGLASLRLPGLTFAELRRGLAHSDVPLAMELPRSIARAAIELLAQHGVRATARPCAARARPPPPRSRGGTLAVAGVVAVLAVAGVYQLRRQAPPPSVPSREAAAHDRTSPAEPAAAAAQSSHPARDPNPSAALTTQEIASRAIDSVAEVTCGGNLGTAFFVAPELAVTNAHVVCGENVPLRVRLKDGRDFMGRPITFDKRLDFAVVQVPGAAVRPIELGDSTALAPGDPVVFIGNPHGLDFTVHDGKVSYAGRNLLGVAYVQLNGSVNPGNSGGPLLDGRGRAVGIVSMKVIGADAIGLALPIEYLRSFLPGSAPPSDDARARWQATLERVRQDDAAEVEKYRRKYRKPAVVGVSASYRGLHATVLRRWPGGTNHLSVTFDVQVDEQTLCSAHALIWDWEDVEKAIDKELRDSPDQPRLKWASANRTLQDVHAAVVPLDFGGCKLSDVPGSAILVVRDGDEADAPIHFPRGAVADASARAAEAAEQARRAAEERSAERSQATWRNAFRKLRAEVAALESKRDHLQRSVQDSVPTSDPNDPRRQLADVEARLAKARAALDDLERRASAEAVPREWRD